MAVIIENGGQYTTFNMVTGFVLENIATIHNSQGKVNRMEYVILLKKGNKAPPLGQIIFLFHSVWLFPLYPPRSDPL